MRTRALAMLIAGFLPALASSPTCNAVSTAALLRAEGLTEPLGDIVLNCTGGAPLGTITTTLTVFAPVNITNRLHSDQTVDVKLEVDGGSGFQPSPTPATLISPSAVAFNGVTLRFSSGGTAALRIRNLRIAAHQLPASLSGHPVQVYIGASGLSITGSQASAGISVSGLLASSYMSRVPCAGSPLPETITFSNLIRAGTRSTSIRLTEGAASSFRAREAGEDNGTRFLVRYAGVPAGARLFVPDVVAGSSALQPTAAGDMGAPAGGGRWAPSATGSLLLARVAGADSSGAGGTPTYRPGGPGSDPLSFDSVSEVALAGGAGYVVYEVLDANPLIQESAQIPVFLGLSAPPGSLLGIASWTVSLAPVSTVSVASSSAPVPRFAQVAPPLDCTVLGDCNAPYFPRLVVEATPPLEYSAVSGGGHQVGYVRVANEGGGVLVWRVVVVYQDGSGWLRVDPTEGFDNATIRVDALPANLGPGTYRATLTVDAGPLAGSRSLPVTLRVSPAPPPSPPPPPPPPAVQPPVIEAITNAASFRAGPIAPASLVTIFGSRLAGASVAVSFDGLPARVFYISAGQLNLQAPPGLAGRSSAQVVVTVDGVASAAFSVPIAPVAPGIFGVLNQDNTLNSKSNPAAVGSIIQIFATGLPEDGRGVSAKIHDRLVTAPLYAGPAPGLAGVQQVNVIVPADLPAMTTEVLVCAAGACSPPVPLVLAR